MPNKGCVAKLVAQIDPPGGVVWLIVVSSPRKLYITLRSFIFDMVYVNC